MSQLNVFTCFNAQEVSQVIQSRFISHLLSIATIVQQIAETDSLPSTSSDIMVLHLHAQKTQAKGFEIQAKKEAVKITVKISGSDLHMGIYKVLQLLGFGFMAPGKIYIPPVKYALECLLRAEEWNVKQEPYWNVRRWHIHTQHPTHLCEFLNGFDADVAWHDVQHDFEEQLEWFVVHGVESFELIPLWTEKCDARALVAEERLQVRFDRWKSIVETSHEYGIKVGVDVPIELQQQHSWTLSRNFAGKSVLSLENVMVYNLDLFIGEVGFDFISTEIGSTEFTSPSGQFALGTLNFIARHLLHKYELELPVKIHISQGQKCKDLLDEEGLPLNFNFMPSLAADNVILMPHTVQLPSLNGDFVDSYGNQDYQFMLDFIKTQQSTSRKIIWYPETSYWVNYDIDVPLFLPVYMLTRLRDARILYTIENQVERKFEGQMIFESGWEWGYWMQNIVTSQISHCALKQTNEIDALKCALCAILIPFKSQPAVRENVLNCLIELIYLQEKFLCNKNSIMGYLVGRETWSDTSSWISDSLRTLPGRTSLNRAKWSRHWYIDIKALDLMEKFAESLEVIQDRLLEINVEANSQRYLEEIIDGIRILVYRSKFTVAVYSAAMASTRSAPPAARSRA